MVSEFSNQSLIEYQKLYIDIEAMGAPEEALQIVRKSIDDNKLLIKQREARELESRTLPIAVSEKSPQGVEAPEGLRVGNSLKTSELVELFGTDKQKESYEKTKKLKSGTKDAVLKEASRHMEIEAYKQGKQLMYKIINIYSEAKPIETNGYIERSETIPLIQALILHMLSNENGTIILTSSKIAMIIQMVNSKYNTMWSENKLCGTEYEERFIKSEIAREVSGNIKRALSSMKKRHLLYYNNNLFVVTYENIKRVATDEEKKVITKARKHACKELGCINYNMVKFKGKTGRFHSIVSNKLNEWGFKDIKNYFEGYEVNADVVEARHELEKTLKELKQKELNTVIYNKLLDRMINKYTNDGVGFGDNVKLRFIPAPCISKAYLDAYVKAK